MVRGETPAGVKNEVDQISVCLFFSYGLSLKKWDELGLFDREIMLYKRMRYQGINVTFFTYGNESDLTYQDQLEGIKIIPACLNKTSKSIPSWIASFWFPFKFRSNIKKGCILKTNQMSGAWVPVIMHWLTGNPLFVRCGYELFQLGLKRGKPSWWRLGVYMLSHMVYSNARVISLTSKHSSEFVQKTYGIDSQKINIIPNFINSTIFSPNKINTKDNRRVLFIGRLSKEKNIISLIDACKKINVGLDIIGDGLLLSVLEKHVSAINADVHFLGLFPNAKLPAIINRYMVYVLPSLYEGNPKTLLESMSCGVAVVGTDVEGIREVITDGVNGLLCTTDVDGIAKAVKKLMDNPSLRESLGRAARSYILGTCSLDATVRSERQLYSQLVNWVS